MIAKIKLTCVKDKSIIERITLEAFEDIIKVHDKSTFEETEMPPANVDTVTKYIVYKKTLWDATIKIIKTDRHEQ